MSVVRDLLDINALSPSDTSLWGNATDIIADPSNALASIVRSDSPSANVTDDTLLPLNAPAAIVVTVEGISKSSVLFTGTL